MKLIRNVMLIAFLFAFFPIAGFTASIVVNWTANTESDLSGYKVYCSTQSGSYGNGTDVGNVTSCQITNAAAGATYYVAVSAYDTASNESDKSSPMTVYVPVPDTTPPSGTVSINSGAATTPSRVVTLTLSATDTGGSVTGMKISNDGVTWTAEAAFSATQTWALTEGDGAKTVYVNFKDAAGNWMATPVSATITLKLDSDGDGLTDAWETSYGLDASDPTDAALDKDSDGFSNLEEFYNGTNPANASDCLPTVEAGANQQVSPTRVYLNGSISNNPSGLTLQYSWSFVRGPVEAVTIDNPTNISASFVGTTAGVYTFQLACSNGRATAYDTVAITIDNVKPTVNAGSDMTIEAGTSVTLHATGADANGDDLNYQWYFTQGTAMTLPDMTQQDITLTFSTAGQYRFSATCSDGKLTSDADEIIVTVNAVNHAPTAEAGTDKSVQAGTTVTLDGSASSDPDGDALAYSWSQTSGTAVTISNPLTSKPSFAASVAGTYVFALAVHDGKVWSVSDSVMITVLKQNNAPIADAGADASAYVGNLVTLNAGSSYDPDGDAVTYSWTQTSGATVVLSGAQTAQPAFTPTVSGVLGFTVTVSDGQVTSQDSVLVTINDVNQVPIAEAGDDKTAMVGTTVSLDGSQSKDPDGDAISFIWSQISGPSVSLSSSNSSRPSFVPRQAGTYVFQLKVYDGTDTSTPDAVTATVQQAAVTLSLGTPQNGATVSSNPYFTWSGTGFARYKVFITLDRKKYSNIYNGSSTTCRMNSSLWNWFIPSGTTIYWYVQGTTTSGQIVNSSMFSFRKQ